MKIFFIFFLIFFCVLMAYARVDRTGLSAITAQNHSELTSQGKDAQVWVPQAMSGTGKRTVIYRTCPWASDNSQINWPPVGFTEGWGNQCFPPLSSCCTPPACPVNWTDLGTKVEVTQVVSPQAPSNNGVDYFVGGADYHPVTIGRVVRMCVKNQ
jgi:hypothetical protein